MASELPDVYKALVKKAKSGDCSAMKLFFEIVETIDEQKQKAAEFRRGVDPLQKMLDMIHQKDIAGKNKMPLENATHTDS